MTEDDTKQRLVRVVSLVGMVAVVLLLAVGAAIVGAPQTVGPDEAGDYLTDFYEAGDVEGFVGALAPASVAEDQLDQVTQQLRLVLQPGVEVANSATFTVNGETVTRVTTSDFLNWCVDEGGAIFVRCKLGEAPVEVRPDGLAIDATVHQVDVFADSADLVLGLEATADEVAFPGLALQGGDGGQVDASLDQAALAAGPSLVPTDPDEVVLASGTALLLVYGGTADGLVDRQLQLVSDAGSATLDVGPIEWFL